MPRVRRIVYILAYRSEKVKGSISGLSLLFAGNAANLLLSNYQARNRDTQPKGRNIACLRYCFARNNTSTYD